jgi:hypothetical protein
MEVIHVVIPLSDPMPSDVSRTGEDDDRFGSAGGELVGAVAGSSSPRFSRKVADGAKNKLPVMARLKSRSRS